MTEPIRACVDVGSPTLAIRVQGKVHYFENPAGTVLYYTGKHGRELKEPGPTHAFWKAVELWDEQGKRVANGLCVWGPSPPSYVRRLWGRNFEAMPEGWAPTTATRLKKIGPDMFEVLPEVDEADVARLAADLQRAIDDQTLKPEDLP